VAAVREGLITRDRLDEAVSRVLRVKFEQGLFDNPYVDVDKVASLVGTPEARRMADAAQRRAITVVTPLTRLPRVVKGRKVWLYGVSPDAARLAGLVPVEQPERAELAIIRMRTPTEKLHPYNFFGSMQSEGRVDFRKGDPGYDALKAVAGRLPAYVGIDMERPAAISNLTGRKIGILAIFGATDQAFLDVLVHPALAKGRLPFPLPQ
jgi:beta-glucosidase